jgi:hypothetical protein
MKMIEMKYWCEEISMNLWTEKKFMQNILAIEGDGSLLLANNNFYRQFTDDPAITVAAQALPQMQGSGLVRDLRPAMRFKNSLKTRRECDLRKKSACSLRGMSVDSYQKRSVNGDQDA